MLDIEKKLISITMLHTVGFECGTGTVARNVPVGLDFVFFFVFSVPPGLELVAPR